LKTNQFTQLSVWTMGMEICEEIYKLTRVFPKEERYGLVSQMRRAAVSIPSNISEGFNRHQRKDFRHFLQIANGSCAELETQVLLSRRLGFISEIEKSPLHSKLIVEQKMLKTFIQKLNVMIDPALCTLH